MSSIVEHARNIVRENGLADKVAFYLLHYFILYRPATVRSLYCRVWTNMSLHGFTQSDKIGQVVRYYLLSIYLPYF